jgi:hypothetical protein
MGAEHVTFGGTAVAARPFVRGVGSVFQLLVRLTALLARWLFCVADDCCAILPPCQPRWLFQGRPPAQFCRWPFNAGSGRVRNPLDAAPCVSETV